MRRNRGERRGGANSGGAYSGGREVIPMDILDNICGPQAEYRHPSAWRSLLPVFLSQILKSILKNQEEKLGESGTKGREEKK